MQCTPQQLAKQFSLGQYVPSADAAVWRQTFLYLAQRGSQTQFDADRVSRLWQQYGGDVRAKIQEDGLILQVLRMALPRASTESCTLYRGESWHLYEQQQIGFCWTRSEAEATRYAKGLNAVESGGVLLSALAPSQAILAHPAPDSPHQVYICDPTQLEKMRALAWFPKP